MPVSENVFDDVVKQMICLTGPQSVLDIGVGAGKYGRMVRELQSETGRIIHLTGVEISDEKVIQRFRLRELYDEILHENAADLPRKYPGLHGEIAICGDMIEHLRKSEGADLIEYLQYRYKHLFLVIPVDWVSFGYKDYDHEAHISIWRSVDFERFHGAYCVEKIASKGKRFLLASVNSILLGPEEHFVVRQTADGRIEFGYLNAPAA